MTAGGRIDIGAGSVEEANAVGNIALDTWNSVYMVRSQSDVTCHNNQDYDEIHAAGSVNGCNIVQNGVLEENAQPPPAIDVMDKLEKISVDQPSVDVWSLKDDSNYAFEEDGGNLKVTVSNVNGLADGVYYLGTYPLHSGNREFLCETVNASNECTTPSFVNAVTICQGFSSSNSCFTYDDSVEEWEVDGVNLAPGVLWFKGDLKLRNGQYYNTFLATGDIATKDNLEVTAVNAAGADVICDNDYPSNPTNEFDGMYPTNSCKQSAGVSSLVPRAVGNAALMAGGYDPNDAPGTFSGGVITLGASSKITGMVVAGDSLRTGGSSTIQGHVVAAGQGEGDNEISASTTIDLRNLPPTYTSMLPDGGGNGGSGGTREARIFWSRYM